MDSNGLRDTAKLEGMYRIDDIPVASFQSQIGFTPASNQEHLNIFITDPSGAPPTDLAGQSIINNALAAQINMSTACAVNAQAPTTTGSGGLNGY